MKKRTRIVHPTEVGMPPGNRALVAPIYQSVKFTFDDVGETKRFWQGQRDGFYYSRLSNPTLRQLELALSDLQERDGCLLTASGIGAIAIPLLTLLKAGDHVAYCAEMYGPTRALIRRVLGRFGVTSTILSIEDLDGLRQLFESRPTRMFVFESPTNPVLKVADLERITTLAQRHGVLTLLDNTLAGLHNHGGYAIDVFVHSLTKYASGHGDAMGGAILARRELIESMRADAGILGAPLDPHAAFLIHRGLKSYFLRWDAQCAAALRVATFLTSHRAVERVRYPGLVGDPGHDLARRQMQGFGTIVAFDIKGGLDRGTRFAEALELFALAASLGSTESLVVAPAMQQPADLTGDARAWAAIGPGTVRLSIGIEDVDDLCADLGQALDLSAAS
jgi:cystathionine beta-lyase/cystathionine gamma-synthase